MRVKTKEAGRQIDDRIDSGGWAATGSGLLGAKVPTAVGGS